MSWRTKEEIRDLLEEVSTQLKYTNSDPAIERRLLLVRPSVDGDPHSQYIGKTRRCFPKLEDKYGEWMDQYWKKISLSEKSIWDSNDPVFDSFLKYLNYIPRAIPRLEPVILKSPRVASFYSIFVLKKRWREAESLFLNSPPNMNVLPYIKKFFLGPWPAIEPIILRHPRLISGYVSILKRRWLACEGLLLKCYPSVLDEYLRVLSPWVWPEAEAKILEQSNPSQIVRYATKVRKERWKEGETVLIALLREEAKSGYTLNLMESLRSYQDHFSFNWQLAKDICRTSLWSHSLLEFLEPGHKVPEYREFPERRGRPSSFVKNRRAQLKYKPKHTPHAFLLEAELD